MRVLYPPQDAWALGEHYLRHVTGMLREGLESKSDIAAQLAWRDAEIVRLRSQVSNINLYMELSEAIGCDPMDTHTGRLQLARRLRVIADAVLVAARDSTTPLN